jgi:prepilin signal peptidase PulO-like enzyme (type II secretory pathway)
MIGSGVTQPNWVFALSFVENGGLAYLALRLLDRESAHTRIGFLAAIAGIVGVINFAHGVPLFPGLVLVWGLCVVFFCAVAHDLRTKRVPILVVLPVTAFAGAIDFARGDWSALAIGLAIAILFGLASLHARDRQAGFGDAALAALAGLAFGMELGTIVVAAACFAAAGLARAQHKTGLVTFAPYLAATVSLALLVPGR